MENNVLTEFYKTTPPVTRILLCVSAAFSIMLYVGFLKLEQVSYCRFNLFDFEIYRVFTSFFCYGKSSYDTIAKFTLLYTYSSMLEHSYSRTSDYFFVVCLLFISLFITSSLFYIPFLATSLSNSIMYLWSRKNPQMLSSIYGFFSYSAFYSPFLYPTIFFIFDGHIPKEELVGIVIGHIIYYFTDLYPRLGGNFLKTPCLLHRLFGESCEICSESKKNKVTNLKKEITRIIEEDKKENEVSTTKDKDIENKDYIEVSNDKDYIEVSNDRDYIEESNDRDFIEVSIEELDDRDFIEVSIEELDDRDYDNVSNEELNNEDYDSISNENFVELSNGDLNDEGHESVSNGDLNDEDYDSISNESEPGVLLEEKIDKSSENYSLEEVENNIEEIKESLEDEISNTQDKDIEYFEVSHESDLENEDLPQSDAFSNSISYAKNKLGKLFSDAGSILKSGQGLNEILRKKDTEEDSPSSSKTNTDKEIDGSTEDFESEEIDVLSEENQEKEVETQEVSEEGNEENSWEST